MEPRPGDPDDVAGSPYAMAKWAATAYGQMFHRLYDVPAVFLRLHMVYGPGQRDPRKLLAHVILSLLRGQAPRISSGEWEVDWVYRDDVVDACLAAVSARAAEGSTVDVGSGELVTIRDVVGRLVRIVDPGVTPEFGAVDDRPLEYPRRADPATWRAIGWRPATDLDDGLRHTVAWFRERVAAGDF
jgi:UDP-glucose 4-epimerase